MYNMINASGNMMSTVLAEDCGAPEVRNSLLRDMRRKGLLRRLLAGRKR